MLLNRACAAGVGYVVGTFPSADVATWFAERLEGKQHDLRNEGSGNPGAANTTQILGKKWGLVVLAADIAKGVVAGRLGRRSAGDLGVHAACTAAVAGHCYPVWNGFRGGKGVATSVGQVLVSFPAYFPLDLGVAVGTFVLPMLRDRAFVATMTAGMTWIASSALWWRRSWPNAWGPEPSLALPVSAAASTALIFRKFVETERFASS